MGTNLPVALAHYHGANPLEQCRHILLFYMAAQLALDNNDLNKILVKMREIGAEL